MFTRKVNVTSITFASLLIIASGVWFSSSHTPGVLAAEAKDTKVKALLKEKLSIVQEVASRKRMMFRAEQVSSDEVYEANQALHNAELELCDTSQ